MCAIGSRHVELLTEFAPSHVVTTNINLTVRSRELLGIRSTHERCKCALFVRRLIKKRNVVKLILFPVVNRVLNAFTSAPRVYLITPDTPCTVLAVFVKRIEVDTELLNLRHIAVVVCDHPLAGLECRICRRHALAHHFDDRVRAVDLYALFTESCRSRGSNFVVDKQAATDQRRGSDASRQPVKQAGGRRSAGNLPALVDRHTVDGSSWWMGDVLIGKRQQPRSFRGSVIERALLLLFRRCKAGSPGIIIAHALFPAQPDYSRFVSQQIHFFEAVSDRKTQRAGSNEQDVVRAFHYKLCDLSRILYSLNRSDCTCAHCRTMHHARIKLYDAVFVGQAAVADAHVFWIVFNDGDPSDYGVERVLAVANHLHRFGGSAQAVRARDHQWPRAF